jgi:hypothetical protein
MQDMVKNLSLMEITKAINMLIITAPINISYLGEPHIEKKDFRDAHHEVTS